MSTPRLDRLSRARQALILALAAMLSGCGMVSPNGPSSSGPTTVENPVIAHTPDAEMGGSPETPDPKPRRTEMNAPADVAWYYVARQRCAPGVESTLRGSHYRLDVHAGSLADTADISIQEYSPKYLEIRLEQHGLRFNQEVDLYVEYRGTNADPLSPNYDGGIPVLLWLNPDTGMWEFVSGLNLKDLKTFKVRLKHFSQYAITTQKNSGDAEWQ